MYNSFTAAAVVISTSGTGIGNRYVCVNANMQKLNTHRKFKSNDILFL